MADVIIRNMDMPDVCWDCNLESPVCELWRDLTKDEMREKRHPDCPLIEITSHGRLGDLDEAEKKIVRLFNYSADGYSQDNVDGYEDGLIDAQNAVRNIPTILPASEVK